MTVCISCKNINNELETEYKTSSTVEKGKNPDYIEHNVKNLINQDKLSKTKLSLQENY